MNEYTASTPFMRYSSEQFSPSVESMETMSASMFNNQPLAYASEGRGTYRDISGYGDQPQAEFYDENNMPSDVSIMFYQSRFI